MHDGQWKAALRRAWSFISRLVCQNIHPWKDSSWTLCRFGCGLHTLSSGTDNPVSKLFRWDHWFLLCQDSDIWFLMFIFLYLLVQIPTNRPEIQIGKLAMSWCEDRKSGVYQVARVPRKETVSLLQCIAHLPQVFGFWFFVFGTEDETVCSNKTVMTWPMVNDHVGYLKFYIFLPQRQPFQEGVRKMRLVLMSLNEVP